MSNYNDSYEFNECLDFEEECYICGEEVIDLDDLFVATHNDKYICRNCMKKYNIVAISCRDY